MSDPATSQPQAQDPMLQLCAHLRLPSPPARLVEALTHPSFSNEANSVIGDNQRLEFLGDAVLGLCASELLMEAFEEVDEGALTVMRASLVNGKALAEIARTTPLPSALRLGRGARLGSNQVRASVLADALEAVLGAIYLEFGLTITRDVARYLVAPKLLLLVENGGVLRDPKSRLQEALQGRGLKPPSYVVTGSEGPPHQRTFLVQCLLPVLSEGQPQVGFDASGPNKKAAEQAAAGAALAGLTELTENAQQTNLKP